MSLARRPCCQTKKKVFAADVTMPKNSRSLHCPGHHLSQVLHRESFATLFGHHLRDEAVGIDVQNPQDLPGEITLDDESLRQVGRTREWTGRGCTVDDSSGPVGEARCRRRACASAADASTNCSRQETTVSASSHIRRHAAPLDSATRRGMTAEVSR